MLGEETWPAVPRSLFDRLGFWNEAVGRKGEHRGTFEDTEFQDRLRQAGWSRLVLPNGDRASQNPATYRDPTEDRFYSFPSGAERFLATRDPGLA